MLPKKITYFTPYFLPQSEAAAIRNSWFVKILREEGHEVEVLSSIPSSPGHTKLFFSKASNKSSAITRLIIECFLGIELFVRLLFQSKDLYILSSPPFFSCLFASWALRLKGAKYILDIRDLYPEVFFDFNLVSTDSVLGKTLKRLAHQFYLHADAIITVTEGLQEEISRETGKQVSLILNGFDETVFYPSLEKYAQYTVVFHGTLGKVQNIELILKAAELLQDEDIKFLFVGDGSKGELIKASTLKNIVYLGAQAYDKIPMIINKAHLGISARIETKIGKEALPVKVFEYFGVGIPVICTPAGAIEPILKKHSAGIALDQATPETLAATILNMKKESFLPDVKSLKEYSRREQSKKILTVLRSH